MAEKLKLLAPYGGITRIRFKGSPMSASPNRTLSQWLPRNNYRNQTSGRWFEVNAAIPKSSAPKTNALLRSGATDVA